MCRRRSSWKPASRCRRRCSSRAARRLRLIRARANTWSGRKAVDVDFISPLCTVFFIFKADLLFIAKAFRLFLSVTLMSAQTKGEKLFRGIAVSAGICRGKILVLHRARHVIAKRTLADENVALEVSRFEKSLVHTRQQISEVQRKVVE